MALNNIPLLASENKEAECLKILKELIKEDEEFEWCRDLLSEEFLLHFIRGRKYNVDKALNTMKRYFHVRKVKHKDLFLQIVPSLTQLKDWQVAHVLKSPSPNGSIVAVTRTLWWPQPGSFTLDDALHKIILMGEELWKKYEAELHGVEVIVEFTGYTWKHTRMAMSIPHIIKALSIFLDAFPMRYRKLHCIRPPATFKMFHNLAKVLAPKKLVDRILVHDNCYETLYEHIPKSMLPQWVNGDLTEEEAFDYSFHDSILKNDEFYKNFREKLL